MITDLLISAHLGEAQAFIECLNLRKLPRPGCPHFYEHHDRALLVCGEGAAAALSGTSAFLAQEPGIVRIINVGAAGALHASIAVDQVIGIRTVYGQKDSQDPFYQSFSSADLHAQIDCISSIDRVTHATTKTRLGHFAAVVDRELWSIAFAAKRFSKEFLSFKFVSDRADANVDCAAIKGRAQHISQQLLKAYLDFAEAATQKAAAHRPSVTPLPVNLYLTTSQRQQLNRISHRLRLSSDWSAKETARFIKAKSDALIQRFPNLSAKRRSQMLIQNLNAEVKSFEL